MFIRLPRLKSNRVIDLQGKALEIIRLPDESASEKHREQNRGFNVALVVIHDVSKPPSYIKDKPDNEYWYSFTQLAEAETDITMLDIPLFPLMDEICDAIEKGRHLFTLNNEQAFVPYDKAGEIYRNMREASSHEHTPHLT
ncbi:MAG: hypothetical protein OXU23_01995 [Candidatus Poribacteria bacterium]|nr:hypothetical protein [Candidatus Poribacteria bacterium]